MQLQSAFNPMDHDPTAVGLGGLPVGKHPVVIKAAELKSTQDNTGGFVEFTLEAIDGPAKGSQAAYRLNLYNKSEKAVKIAHSQLSALCHVTRQFQLGADGRQLSVLFNIPFVVEVKLQKGEEAAEKGYTEIAKVYDMGGQEPGKAAQQPQQAQQQPVQQTQPQQGQQGGWGQQQPAQQQPAQQGGGWQQPAQQQQAAQQPQQAQGGWQQGQQPQQGQQQGQPPAAWGPQG